MSTVFSRLFHGISEFHSRLANFYINSRFCSSLIHWWPFQLCPPFDSGEQCYWNIGVQYLSAHFQFSWVHTSRRGIAGQCVNSVFHFWGTTILFPAVAVFIHFRTVPPPCVRAPTSPLLTNAYFLFFPLLRIDILVSVKAYLIMVLTCLYAIFVANLKAAVNLNIT